MVKSDLCMNISNYEMYKILALIVVVPSFRKKIKRMIILWGGHVNAIRDFVGSLQD